MLKIIQKTKRTVAPVAGALCVFLISAASSFAAIDYTDVQTEITTGVGDFTAGALILLGAFATIWGIRKVMALFGHGR